MQQPDYRPQIMEGEPTLPSQPAMPPRNDRSFKKHSHNRHNPPRERRRRFGFWKFYFLICGITVNVYGLIWLMIQLLKRLGTLFPN